MIHKGLAPACHRYQVHDLSDQKAAAEHLAALAEERVRRKASALANASKGDPKLGHMPWLNSAA